MPYDSRRRDFLRLTSALGAGLALGGSASLARASGDASAPEKLSFFETVRKRRSVRSFQATPIPKEHIDEIIKAACLAPTSGNQQPWKFLVVDDAQQIAALRENCIAHQLARYAAQAQPTEEQLAERRTILARNLAEYFSAPVYIIVLTSAKSRYPDYNHWDGPLAAANLMLAARALGYGTVFITDSIPDEVTRATFHIPDHLTRVCITPLGIPEAWPRKPSKKPWRSFVQKNSF